jgi:MoaA/NifB/PqqE/SkfB family radical SAM enzyme
MYETLMRIFIKAGNNGYDKFSFSISGGEPTKHPDFIKILDHIFLQNSRVHITTNCSHSIKWFKQLKKYSDKISITASFHPEFTKRKIFLDKIKLLKDMGIKTQVNIVLVHDNFDEMYNHAIYFYNNDIDTQTKIQLDYIDGETFEKKYTEEQLNKIKNSFSKKEKPTYLFKMIDKNNKEYYIDNLERLLGLNFNRYKDWICEAGYRSIIITEPSGDVKRHFMCKDKPLGNIETGFELYNKPRKCITEICGSSADCKIPKWKENKNE